MNYDELKSIEGDDDKPVELGEDYWDPVTTKKDSLNLDFDGNKKRNTNGGAKENLNLDFEEKKPNNRNDARGDRNSEDSDYDFEAKPEFDFKNKKRLPPKKENLKPEMSVKFNREKEESLHESVDNLENSLSMSRNYSQNRFNTLSKPNFKQALASKSRFTKSMSDGNLLKGRVVPSATLERVKAYIKECKRGGHELMDLFNLNSKGSHFMKEISLVLD